MISGVCNLESFCLNCACAACRAFCRGSHEHVRTCVVISHSWLHAKHWPSLVLLNICSRKLVGRRSLVYLEIWMRRPRESFSKVSPKCFQSIVSYVSSSQDFSRLVAVCDRRMWYCCIAGVCFASRMYLSTPLVTCLLSWKRAARVPVTHVGKMPVFTGSLW
jgi:hypothetical protein